jgi:hypothetical protein
VHGTAWNDPARSKTLPGAADPAEALGETVRKGKTVEIGFREVTPTEAGLRLSPLKGRRRGADELQCGDTFRLPEGGAVRLRVRARTLGPRARPALCSGVRARRAVSSRAHGWPDMYRPGSSGGLDELAADPRDRRPATWRGSHIGPAIAGRVKRPPMFSVAVARRSPSVAPPRRAVGKRLLSREVRAARRHAASLTRRRPLRGAASAGHKADRRADRPRPPTPRIPGRGRR